MSEEAKRMSEEGKRLPEEAKTIFEVGKSDKKKLDEKYNSFEARNLKRSMSDEAALLHLMKASLGTGILAMPMAFMNAGLWFGLIATLFVGFICTYCAYILVKSSQILCHRKQIPALDFAETVEYAFLNGPKKLRKFSKFSKCTINTYLAVFTIGLCSIYLIFVAKNIQHIINYYIEKDINIRIYIVIIMPPLLYTSLIKNLNYLIPFSTIANILLSIGLCIIMSYVLLDLPSVTERPIITNPVRWPIFFGIVIFSIEGIGVIMSIENSMVNGQHFLGCPGVLNIGMCLLTLLYALVGFFGYLKYGEETCGTITLNIPREIRYARLITIIISVAIYLSYTLQFFVHSVIIWNSIKYKFSPDNSWAENCLRIFLVFFTVGLALLFPNLEGFMTLSGAVCLSQLGIVFPAIIDLLVHWVDPGLGRYYWRLWSDLFLIFLGILAFGAGIYAAMV